MEGKFNHFFLCYWHLWNQLGRTELLLRRNTGVSDRKEHLLPPSEPPDCKNILQMPQTNAKMPLNLYVHVKKYCLRNMKKKLL